MPRGINDFDAAELQGRNSANANSLSVVSPGLITSGLVLNLDAGNFASYPAADTTWFDVSNNRNNATLTNGPTYSTLNGGRIVFDGVDDYASVTETFGMQPTVLTLEVGFRINDFGLDISAILFRQNARTTAPQYTYMLFSSASDTTLYFSTSVGVAEYTVSSNVISTAVDYVATVVIASTRVNLYLNGVLQQPFGSTTKAAGLSYGTTSTLQIGRESAPVGVTNFNGSVYFVRKYNRALSAAEVERNFNATRARFGL